MEKAVIIELLYHHECVEILYNIYKNFYHTSLYIGEFVDTFINISNISNENIHIISQPVRCKKFKVKGLKHLLYEFVEFFEFLKNSVKIIIYLRREKPNVIHLATVDNPFIVILVYLINFLYKGKIAVTLHETHRWGTDKRFFNYSDYLLYWIHFRILSKKISYFSVLGNYLKIPNSLKDKNYFVINNRNIEIQEYEYLSDKIAFTITGIVDTNRKNYQIVLKAFSKLLSKKPELKMRLKIVLLGTMRDPKVYNLIKVYNLVECTTTFDDFIKEKTFKDYIKKTDFLIIPTYKDTPYGNTKISGSFGDAVSFGIPFLLSNYYAKDFSFPENVIRFDDDTLEEIILKCINIKLNKQAYLHLKDKAIVYSKNFKETMEKLDLNDLNHIKK